MVHSLSYNWGSTSYGSWCVCVCATPHAETSSPSNFLFHWDYMLQIFMVCITPHAEMPKCWSSISFLSPFSLVPKTGCHSIIIWIWSIVIEFGSLDKINSHCLFSSCSKIRSHYELKSTTPKRYIYKTKDELMKELPHLVLVVCSYFRQESRRLIPSLNPISRVCFTLIIIVTWKLLFINFNPYHLLLQSVICNECFFLCIEWLTFHMPNAINLEALFSQRLHYLRVC